MILSQPMFLTTVIQVTRTNYAKLKGAVSQNSAKIFGNYKVPVKLRET